VVARWAHNPKVTGSSPVPATKTKPCECEAFFMFCVYVLYSFKHDRLYIGQSIALIKRFHSHNVFGTKGFTIRFRPWFVILTEFYVTKKEALFREKQLKSGKGRDWIRNHVLPFIFNPLCSLGSYPPQADNYRADCVSL
jgi:putative endonuclease